MTLFSRMAGFRCSGCQALQPAFALMTTCKDGALMTRLNKCAPCPGCGSRLRLTPAGPWSFWGVTLGFGLLARLPLGLVFFCVGAFLQGAVRARMLRHLTDVEIVT